MLYTSIFTRDIYLCRYLSLMLKVRDFVSSKFHKMMMNETEVKFRVSSEPHQTDETNLSFTFRLSDCTSIKTSIFFFCVCASEPIGIDRRSSGHLFRSCSGAAIDESMRLGTHESSRLYRA